MHHLYNGQYARDVAPTGLDNSHDACEESVTSDLHNAPYATPVPDGPVIQEQPRPETPSVFPRLFKILRRY